MRIPFTKAHGARNDFLLTWDVDVSSENASGVGLPAIARAICDRHAGVGADGWILVRGAVEGRDDHASIRLFNADGSPAEISGNGTRCAAAFLFDTGSVAGSEVRISTGAGPRLLRLIENRGLHYLFEMNMGTPEVGPEGLRYRLELPSGPQDVTVLNAGNPQCAVFVQDFNFDWRAVGAEIESHSLFPRHTNVSFVKPVDEHSIEVRFYERGVGETMSSGTGSTGAAAAAVLRGVAARPVRVLTPAGPLDLRWEGADIYLTGPAVIVAGGEFYYEK